MSMAPLPATPPQNPDTSDKPNTSPLRMHLLQQLQNTLSHRIQIRIYLFQGARWLIHIKMAVKRDFITDNTDLAIFGIALVRINPRSVHLGLYFFFEVGFVDFID